MAIYAENNGGGNLEPVAAGNYVARCYSMIHIGTVQDVINGQSKLVNKVRLTFELPTETKEFREGEGPKPYSIGKDFTLSMNEKATLRKMLESWRGKSFTEEEAKRFDVTKLLGIPCMINVIHKTSKTGKNYAEIASITPMPKGYECPPQVNPSFEFSYEPFYQAKFDTLPDWIKDRVRSSIEYVAVTMPEHQMDTASVSNSPDDDDLPF